MGFVLITIAIAVGAYLGMMVEIPYTYTTYLAVAIITCLDSVFGGIAAVTQRKFDQKIFLSGFFGNALIAIFLVLLGEKLNIDLYLAAVVAFGNRIFINFSIMRRHFFGKHDESNKQEIESKPAAE